MFEKKSQNIQIKRNKDIFLEYYIDDKLYRYFPDFIEEGNFVEVKGAHLIDKATGQLICLFEKDTEQDTSTTAAKCRAKFECMLENKVIGVSTITIGIWKDDIIKLRLE